MQPRARAARLSGSQRLTYCATVVVVAETEQIPMVTNSISRTGKASIATPKANGSRSTHQFESRSIHLALI